MGITEGARRRWQCIGMVIGVLGLFGVPSSAAALPAKFFGLQFSANYAQSKRDVEAMARSGAKYLRLNLNWGQKISQGWAPLDEAFTLAWEHGITILPTIYGNRNGSAQRPWEAEWKPQGSEWETWLYEVVHRYGYDGTFWQGKQNRLPVAVWEVWNEPNRGANGPDGIHPYPQEYARFLKRSAAALREAEGDPIVVLFGGLLTLKTGWSLEDGGSVWRYNHSVHDFLEEADNVEGAGSAFNGLSLHPYAFAPRGGGRRRLSKHHRRTGKPDGILQWREEHLDN